MNNAEIGVTLYEYEYNAKGLCPSSLESYSINDWREQKDAERSTGMWWNGKDFDCNVEYRKTGRTRWQVRSHTTKMQIIYVCPRRHVWYADAKEVK